MDGSGGSSLGWGVLHVIVSLIGSWHVISTCEVHEVLEDLLVLIIVSLEVFPWLPVFHDSKKLDLIVCLEN